jgi:hypothetical protein
MLANMGEKKPETKAEAKPLMLNASKLHMRRNSRRNATAMPILNPAAKPIASSIGDGMVVSLTALKEYKPKPLTPPPAAEIVMGKREAPKAKDYF